jgi:hypothetical protein
LPLRILPEYGRKGILFPAIVEDEMDVDLDFLEGEAVAGGFSGGVEIVACLPKWVKWVFWLDDRDRNRFGQ